MTRRERKERRRRAALDRRYSECQERENEIRREVRRVETVRRWLGIAALGLPFLVGVAVAVWGLVTR